MHYFQAKKIPLTSDAFRLYTYYEIEPTGYNLLAVGRKFLFLPFDFRIKLSGKLLLPYVCTKEQKK
jgi:hypothetical protein